MTISVKKLKDIANEVNNTNVFIQVRMYDTDKLVDFVEQIDENMQFDVAKDDSPRMNSILLSELLDITINFSDTDTLTVYHPNTKELLPITSAEYIEETNTFMFGV